MAKKRKPQPLDLVEWLPRELVAPNDYNPNKQPPAEFKLLCISLIEDGWTQPIVVFDDGGKKTKKNPYPIVDGAHRWTAAGTPEVAKMTDGLIPVVKLKGNRAHLMMSTIRHNRARGEHGVLPMGDIVKSLLESGLDKSDVKFYLQMEEEEVNRLAERAGMPEIGSRGVTEFSKGWKPG